MLSSAHGNGFGEQVTSCNAPTFVWTAVKLTTTRKSTSGCLDWNSTPASDMLVTSGTQVPQRHKTLLNATSGSTKIASRILIGLLAISRAWWIPLAKRQGEVGHSGNRWPTAAPTQRDAMSEQAMYEDAACAHVR